MSDLRQKAELDLKEKNTRKKVVLDCANYMEERMEMMRYDEYLAAGLPIATGVVEGACKSLIKDRFECSGMRWTMAGAEAMLKVRAVERSGDLDEYWRFHREAENQRLYGRQWEITGEDGRSGSALAVC